VKRTLVIVLTSLAAAAGCSKPNNNAQEPASQPIASPEVREPAKADQTPKTYTATQDMRKIIGKMGKEATARPKAGVTAEPLFDALEAKANIKLLERKQFMGATVGAAFCAGGATEATATSKPVNVAMCEYADDASAQASLEEMNKNLPLANTRREEHHAAVMTVTGSSDDARVDAAFKVFESL
jgi:hypothetical protein